VAAVAATLVVAGCSPGLGDPAAGPSTPQPSTAAPGHHGAGGTVVTPPRSPLREGERFVTVTMPAAYQPKAPAAPGTDDYRCFLLDPRLAEQSVVTGIDVLPGSPQVVHHVILFRVPPGAVARAEQEDAGEAGQGWTCFGGTGVDSRGGTLDSAPWLGAWAPGGGERVLPDDLGMPLPAGSRLIMQVHYNLLAGDDDDRSSARLRLAADDGTRRTLETVLLPAPVELPCRAGHTGSLCHRDDALADLRQRFGAAGGMAANALHVLCGFGDAGPRQSCTRPVTRPSTIRAVAGHMHLLGRSISVVVNEGRDDERTVLDVPVWDFDDQGTRPVDPGLAVGPGDTLTVHCRHDQSLRDRLPAFEGLPERYVVWGEGTTDEMCLGIVMVTRP
jgi:hypothetical protein